MCTEWRKIKLAITFRFKVDNCFTGIMSYDGLWYYYLLFKCCLRPSALTCYKYLHDSIISLRKDAWTYKTSLTRTLFFIEVPVPSQQYARSYICVLGVSHRCCILYDSHSVEFCVFFFSLFLVFWRFWIVFHIHLYRHHVVLIIKMRHFISMWPKIISY